MLEYLNLPYAHCLACGYPLNPNPPKATLTMTCPNCQTVIDCDISDGNIEKIWRLLSPYRRIKDDEL